ncbi:MAG: CotH kinase family protein [Bacteroidota bacterium]|nr:CotH kinase family protein [Bacteroidota bacterium]
MKVIRIFGFVILFLLKQNILYAQIFSSGNIQTPIADNQSMNFYINVSGLVNQTNASFGLESVCFDIQHSNNNDLIIKLIAPDGTEITLASYLLGKNFTGTCLNTTNSTMIIEANSPFTGNYRAEDDLSKFNYFKNPNGIWKLQIIDSKAGNTGFLNNWSLTFSTNPAIPFVESDLPIMVINTNGQHIIREERIFVDVGIIYNGEKQINKLSDQWNHYNAKGSIRYRGQSSMGFPKKGYALDTETINGENLEVPLLGMPLNHKWVLYASYNDKTLLRNVFSYQLFSDIINYSVRTRFVELVINGNYRGVYVLIEKIKRGKAHVPVSKLTAQDLAGDDLTGGYIISIDNKSSKRDGWYSNIPSNTNNDQVYFQYIYPEPGNIQQVQKEYIKSHFHEFENVLKSPGWKDPVNGYRKYIDLPSFLDNFIINELSRNVDAYRKSTYFYKDKDSEGGKIVNGPIWDFDMAWYNANFGGGDQIAGWQYHFGWVWHPPAPGEETLPTPFWWKRFLEDPYFVNELNCRYKNLRRGQLTTDYLNRIIDKSVNDIMLARNRNFHYWPIMGKWVYSNVTPVATSYEEEILRMKDWINNRLIWMDNNLPGNCPDVGIENNEQVVSSFNVFPNPFNELLSFSYYIAISSEVKIDVVNALGVIVYQNYEKNISGLHNGKINTNEFPKGIYLITLTVNDKIFHQKAIKM